VIVAEGGADDEHLGVGDWSTRRRFAHVAFDATGFGDCQVLGRGECREQDE